MAGKQIGDTHTYLLNVLYEHTRTQTTLRTLNPKP